MEPMGNAASQSKARSEANPLKGAFILLCLTSSSQFKRHLDTKTRTQPVAQPKTQNPEPQAVNDHNLPLNAKP